jgi:fructokinase
MRKTVVAFGEILWDLLPTGAKLGGAPFNFAYRVNSLADYGIIVSRLGRDELGKQAWDEVSSLGMDTSHIQWDRTFPTGTVEITLDENNNPDYFIVPDVAYDNVEITEPLLAAVSDADCLCFGTLAQRTPTGRKTLNKLLHTSGGAVKLLDINLRKNCYSTGTITDSLRRANILKLNDEEAFYLASLFGTPGESVASFSKEIIRRFSLDCCVLTLGKRGAFVASADGQTAYVAGYKVDVVDTCGSGDAFTAGFIHSLFRAHPLKQCCELGNAMGAIVASQSGATMPFTTQRIEQFMQAGHARISEPTLEPLL